MRRGPAKIARRDRRAGLSLFEVMIAIVMLAIALTSITVGSLSVGLRSRRVSGRAFGTGLLTREVDRAVAAPIDSLALQLGRTTVDTPVTTPWPFARRITVAGRADSLTVSIAILPLTPVQRADSMTQSVLRTR